MDVVIGDIAVIDTTGDFPADGVVSVDRAETGVERTSGNVILDGGPGVTIHIHGHRTSATADIEGSVLGTALVAPTGDISTVHDNVKNRDSSRWSQPLRFRRRSRRRGRG